MRARSIALAIAVMALVLVPASASSAASQGNTVCTWGGTPTAPTGSITFTPGYTNTPSPTPISFTATGPLGGGCTGKLTFTGVIDPGGTCLANAPFHAKATGLPPVKTAEGGPGVAGSGPVLLYDAQGKVVGSEQAQFLTAAAADPNDPGYTACNTPQGLTHANWSDTIEIFAH